MQNTTLAVSPDAAARDPRVPPTFFHLLFPTAQDALRWASALRRGLGEAQSRAASVAERVVVWLEEQAGTGLAHAYVSRGAANAAIEARIGLPVLELVRLPWLPGGLRLAVGTDADARLYDARTSARAPSAA